MCGIFGLIAKKESVLPEYAFKKVTDALFKLSESRGKESAGLATISNNEIQVYKKATPASTLINLDSYKKLISSIFYRKNDQRSQILIGHARLVTNGLAELNKNNQPVIKDGIVGIHNGIIVNDSQLWKKYKIAKRKYEVDTEIFLSLTRSYLNDGNSVPDAIRRTYNSIEGSVSVALLFQDLSALVLATNTGSLYVCRNQSGSFYIFASEEHILTSLVNKVTSLDYLKPFDISQLRAGTGIIISNTELYTENFSLKTKGPVNNTKIIKTARYRIRDFSPEEAIKVFPSPSTFLPAEIPGVAKEAWEKRLQTSKHAKRCSKCVLPETMPFIEFDEKGVCNYCRSYSPVKIRDHKELVDIVRQYRRNDGKPDCIVALSGGRDSSYGLHYVKKVLKLNPIAFTYDWGMITDLGRRNQARMCGTLGIEHVLVSADIHRKRENIRKNVQAWLKKPELGTIPLFMAGDKQYFYYLNQTMEKTGIKLVIYCDNLLEKTGFKSGFCGIKEGLITSKKTTSAYQGHLKNDLVIALYYLRKFIQNPSYINSSIFDTIGGYLCYYFIPHRYFQLYAYSRWEDKKIDRTLKKYYNWETALDTETTWRIGDGTAAFYNYIYYLGAGFTENDTFRSNQIREGQCTRKEALRLIANENKPRYESIKWYCDAIGLDFKETLKTIALINLKKSGLS